MPTHAILNAAEGAIVAGDEVTLARLLREHEQLLRTERASWFRGLEADDTNHAARMIVAHEHLFKTWDEFAEFAGQLKNASSAVAHFERAADAVVYGDAATLTQLLADDPDVIRARSRRTHNSTLLHYVGANGVETWRQRTPKNIVTIAALLLDAGAEINATAAMYGGGCTTLSLAATSCHPRDAGVQIALIDALLARRARIDEPDGGSSLIVNACLANDRLEAAKHLAEKGALLDLEGAAGIGRLDLVRSFFNADGSLKAPATVAQLKDGFTWACEYGQTPAVEFLLEHGVTADEILPRPHKQTGVHWAAYGGHVDTVKALLRRHPALDIRDASFDGTPLHWALHRWWEWREDPARREPFYEVVALLVAAGAPVERQMVSEEHEREDPRMFAALSGKR